MIFSCYMDITWIWYCLSGSMTAGVRSFIWMNNSIHMIISGAGMEASRATRQCRVYAWVAEVRTKAGKQVIQYGNVTLLR